MRIRSRIWIGIAASVAVSAVIAFFAFSILSDINDDFLRNQKYNSITNRALTLNTLIYDFMLEPGERKIQQAGAVRASLGALLEGISSANDREAGLLAQMRRNNQELGPLLAQFFERRETLDPRLQDERRKMLASQVWIKMRFITDDTDRLMEISQSRIASSLRQAILVVLALIWAVILVNVAISYASSSSIVRKILRLNAGARRIAAGDLEHRVRVRGKDELGELAASFNEMTASLRDSYGKLRQSNRELQDFAYVASHDLQEPLRKIQTFGERIRQKSGAALDDTGQDYLRRMEAAAARMSALIRSLLDYSRITNKPHQLSRVDLNQTLREVIADLTIRLESTGGQVEVSPLPVIEADPIQMRQAFENLVGNALKFHKPDVSPLVKVFCRNGNGDGTACAGDSCEFVVQDNGIGFEEKYLDKIFQPFQRLHGRSEYEGLGMGLAIVRRIIERHHGTITGESTPGGGSRFVLTLPVHQAGQATQEGQEPEPV